MSRDGEKDCYYDKTVNLNYMDSYLVLSLIDDEEFL